MSRLMLLRSEYFSFFNSRPIVFGDARRLHGVCLSTPSGGSEADAVGSSGAESVLTVAAVLEAGLSEAAAVSEADAVGSSRAESVLAVAAVLEAGLSEAAAAVSEADAVESSGVESVLASAAVLDPDSRSFGDSIFASDRRLLRTSFRLPSGSPPVCCSISEVRSASSVGSFFFRRRSSTSFSPDSLARVSFQSRLEFSATSLHRFGIEACDPGHFSYAPPTEDRRNHRRYPPTMFLIQLIAN